MQAYTEHVTTLDNHIWKVKLFVSVTNVNHDHTILLSNHNEAHKQRSFITGNELKLQLRQKKANDNCAEIKRYKSSCTGHEIFFYRDSTSTVTKNYVFWRFLLNYWTDLAPILTEY